MPKIIPSWGQIAVPEVDNKGPNLTQNLPDIVEIFLAGWALGNFPQVYPKIAEEEDDYHYQQDQADKTALFSYSSLSFW